MVSASVGLVLLIPLVAYVVGCNQIEHHEAMTFFFDGLAQSSQKQFWYTHEPRKNCTNCHDKQKQTPGQPFFVAPVPKLCYNCHVDRTVSASFVHGPVAVGECLLCHNPHKSQIEHLLRQPIPKLCYLCHDMNAIESTSAHSIDQLSKCTDCHNAHASSEHALLKEASSQRNGDLPKR